MPDLKFTNEKGQVFEVSGISIEEIAKLAGLNGHNRSSVSLPPSHVPTMFSTITTTRRGPDYGGFKKKLTPKAKQFLLILSQNQSGINADHLASQLGFQSGVQLGGMAGGGMAKHAKDFDVDLSYVYTREQLFVNGVKRVIYKPGADIQSLL
jgi:hypothetical protein